MTSLLSLPDTGSSGPPSFPTIARSPGAAPDQASDQRPDQPPEPVPDPSAAPAGALLVAIVAAAVALVTFSLAVHPGFQPVYTVRAVGPVLALMIGAALAHQVARWRRRIDARREFNPTGRSLFLGVVMLVGTGLGWLMATQAVPATFTASLGVARTEVGVVVRKMPEVSDPDCPDRLVVTSASIPREMDECVDPALWHRTTPGGRLTLDLVGGALGVEITGVRS